MIDLQKVPGDARFSVVSLNRPERRVGGAETAKEIDTGEGHDGAVRRHVAAPPAVPMLVSVPTEKSSGCSMYWTSRTCAIGPGQRHSGSEAQPRSPGHWHAGFGNLEPAHKLGGLRPALSWSWNRGTNMMAMAASTRGRPITTINSIRVNPGRRPDKGCACMAAQSPRRQSGAGNYKYRQSRC